MTGSPKADVRISVRKLSFFYGTTRALLDNDLDILDRKVTALIGPSGCGKSTHIRCYNRMYELYPGQHAEGEVLLDGQNILNPRVSALELRHRIGMIFQKPTPFPMSVFDNSAYVLRLRGGMTRHEGEGWVRRALVAGGCLAHPASGGAVAWRSQLKPLGALALAEGALLVHPRRPLRSLARFALALLTKAVAMLALPVAAVWS